MAGRPVRSGAFRTIRAAIGTVGIAALLPVLLLLGAILMPLGDVFSGRHRLGYEIGRQIIAVLWFVGGIRTREVDRWRVEPFRTRVYMPNHQSLTDMPQVLYLLPKANGTLIKKEAFRVPLMGWGFRAAGFTPVDRSGAKAVRASLEAAVTALKGGQSFVIAPEGTRSRTGELGSFKTGGFRLAIQAEVPIAPITISGARDILPPGGKLIYPGTIQVRYHDLIETKGIDGRDRRQIGDLMTQVRAVIQSGLDEVETAPADDPSERKRRPQGTPSGASRRSDSTLESTPPDS